MLTSDIFENVFHFLPYWYFINRAFGAPGTDVDNEVELNQIKNSNVLEVLDAQRLLFLQSLEYQQQLVQQNVVRRDLGFHI
jgi:hypothetical protein